MCKWSLILLLLLLFTWRRFQVSRGGWSHKPRALVLDQLHWGSSALECRIRKINLYFVKPRKCWLLKKFLARSNDKKMKQTSANMRGTLDLWAICLGLCGKIHLHQICKDTKLMMLSSVSCFKIKEFIKLPLSVFCMIGKSLFMSQPVILVISGF